MDRQHPGGASRAKLHTAKLYAATSRPANPHAPNPHRGTATPASPHGSASATALLETERTILRPICPDDSDDLLRLYSDPEVMRFINDGVPRTAEQTRELLDRMIAHRQREGFGMCATIDKQNQRMIGRCGLMVQDVEGRREVELGYLLERRYWGRGLATEVALAFRAYARRALALGRLVSIIDPANVASRRVAVKSGGEHERDVFMFGRDCCLYVYESG